jgi:hypothetical protein
MKREELLKEIQKFIEDQYSEKVELDLVEVSGDIEELFDTLIAAEGEEDSVK